MSLDSRTRAVELVDGPIELESFRPLLDDPDVGAQAWFLGVTRRRTAAVSGVRETFELSYEAHRPMAHRELRRLAAAAADRFDLHGVVIVHRLGDVPVGEASVAVGCSSPHRLAAFEALPWIMDRLKETVPIWKRERYADGTTEWVHPGVSGHTS